MQAVAAGLIIGALWLWLEAPLALAVLGGIVAGLLIGMGLMSIPRSSAAPEPSTGVVEGQTGPAVVIDPAASRLLSMGFRLTEIEKPLAKARAEGNPDPVGYVLGSLIR